MAMSFGFRYGHARRDALKRFDDLIKLVRLDDALNQFHSGRIAQLSNTWCQRTYNS
jgi:hypothetical protein